MASKIKINLDTNKENYLVAKCKQNDDITLESTIYENGLSKYLDTSEITIQGLKADNTYIIQDTDISKESNVITANLNRDFTRIAGTTKIEIVLRESGKQNTTFSFYLEVVGSVINKKIESANTVTILETLTNKVVEAVQVKEETEQLIQSGGAATKGEIQQVNSQLAQSQKQILGTSNHISEIDITKMKIEEIGERLNIPVYTGDEAVHPSVLYFPNGWSGHKYWLAFTPYENSDNQVENPSIVCSDDGINWIIPDGVTNPLVPTPVSVGKAVGSYNSDPVLFMDKDNITMHIVYRECFGYPENEGNERLYLISSKDGWKTVTEPRPILTGKSSISRPASPSIRWNGEEYLLWYVDIVPSPRKIFVRKSKELGNWSEPIELSIWDSSIVNPWHFDVIYYNGYYYMLVQGGGSGGGDLFFAKSTNGVNWIANNNKINLVNGEWNNKPYKPSILPVKVEGGTKFKLWLSSIGNLGWQIGYMDINSSSIVTEKTIKDLSQTTNEYKKQNQLMYALNKIPPYVLADTFNRATTDGLGTTNTGQTWKNDTSYFIANNGVASPKSNGNCRNYIDVQNSNVSISFEIKNYSGQLWIFGRMSNLLNYVRVGLRDNTIIIENIISGVATSLGSTNYTVNIGDTFEVKFNGNTVSAFVNGAKKLEANSTLNQNNTIIGIQANNTTTQITNLIVSYLGEIKGSFVEDIVNKKISENVGILLAINKIYPYLIGDNFNRSDSTTGLGIAPSGQSWTNSIGVMAIKNGKASPNSDANTRSIIDSTVSSGRISTRISSLDTQAWIIFRLSDGSNLLRAGYINSSQIELQKIESGTSTVLGYKNSLVYTANDLLEVEYSGSTINVFLNGEKIITSSNTFNQSSTNIGLQATKIGTSFDDFTFKTL